MGNKSNIIALVFIGNIEFCPYLNNYVDIFKKNRVDYDVFYWNRAGYKNIYPKNYYAFDRVSELSKSKKEKVWDFFKFFIWINKHVSYDKYNKIVVLDTLSGFLLYRTLVKHTGKYIMEIRDYSYEGIRIFKRLERKLIFNSYKTMISSVGFKAFLPRYHYQICHNLKENKNLAYKFNKVKPEEPIKLVWAGSVRYYSTQKTIIDELGNDERFLLVYHGTGPQLEKLVSYCTEQGIKNIIFTGIYEESEKLNLMEEAHMILNAYDNVGDAVKYALSNRFYDALLMKKPQIVEKGSYKEEIVKHYGLGVTLDKGLADLIINFFYDIDIGEFEAKCEALYSKFFKENKKYYAKIELFAKENKEY